MLLSFQGWTAPVDLFRAQSVASNFINLNGHLNTPRGYQLKLAYAEKSSIIKDQPVFYVFNTGDGFVIVSGDDRAKDVLAYGDGLFDINNIPCGMRCLLGTYKKQIEFLQTHPKLKVEKASQNTPPLMASSVSPLLKTNWGQDTPYYNHCPKYQGEHCRTGCVATALAQIMQYWSYPSSSPALSAYTTSTNKINVGSLPSKELSYSKTDDAMSWLMRYVGQAVLTDYQLKSSNSNIAKARSAMVNTFNYSSSAVVKRKTDDITDSQWHNWLKSELNAGRPVLYRAEDDESAADDDDKNDFGHVFVIDGYNTSGDYHINWGCDGECNGYFSLGEFNSFGYKFNSYQKMLVGLAPNISLKVTPSSVTFSNKTVGMIYTTSVTVKGTNLIGDLSLKLTGPSGVFSLDKTRITKSEATNGATVTVTYKPTAAGTHAATLTIDCGSLLSCKTVALKGSAVNRTITTSPTSVAFGNVIKGKTVTKNIKVTGVNLTGKLTLSTNSSYYTVSPTSITAEEAKAGKTVAVIYKATTRGTNNATLTIKGGSAADKKVSITGKCINPLITTSVNSLTYDKSSSKSFKVTGTDLTGNLTLAIQGTGKSYFTLNKTSITASEAAGGVNVSVSCNAPSSLQRAIAEVVISGGSASSKTVSLCYVKNKPINITMVEPGGGDEAGNEISDSVTSINTNGVPATGVEELLMSSKVYAEGHHIIIYSPIEQSAIISDIAGHVKKVGLQAGRNEIPVNASGTYIVRIREKTTKLMLK